MGLRTASVRRPYAEVMAPALTDAAQKQTFALPPKPKFLDDCSCCDSVPEVDRMSGSPTLTDQNMGLHKTTLDSVAKMQKSDAADLGLTSPPQGDADLPQNVDELMQVIKSIPDEEIVEKFLTDVDMMNMSMEEQSADLKESQAKETIADLKLIEARINRRIDILRRRIRKFQSRSMGQHVSGEIAGVYEYVHRSLKRLKDNNSSIQLDDENQTTTTAVATATTMKPMSYGSTKTILKKLDLATTMQANAIARQKQSTKYFGSGSCEIGNHRISVPGVVNVPPFPLDHKQELQKVAGLLQTELSVVQRDVDSEATESSSGGESCDEMQTYNNPHQQYLSIQKRALWKYASQRAAIASRWTWLQAQISDLEYRIRQYSEIQRQIRASKGEIQLGGTNPPQLPTISTTTTTSPTTVNGYRGQLPGSPISQKTEVVLDTTTTTANGASSSSSPDYQCARTRPLMNFKKRKLLQLNGLHAISKKASRPSTVRCGCCGLEATSCAVCTGRTDPTHPRDPTDVLSKAERVALVDSGYHSVFSMPEDVSYGVHCEAIMRNPEWQQRSTRMKSLKVIKGDRSDKTLLEHRTKKLEHRKKYNRLLKPSTMSALSAKIRNKIRGRKPSRLSTSSLSLSTYKKRPKLGIYQNDAADEEVESIGNNSTAGTSNSAIPSPSSSPLLHMQSISGYNRRNRTNSYDIDNIVIPYSVAASTRVEKLQYKEILTPKWRIADFEFKCDKNNGAIINPSQDSDAEDLSEDAVLQRHEKSEYEEKKKFLSYLKLPYGHYGRSRSHKRTDSLAESSGANTPDPLSPHPMEHDIAAVNSPITSPPATPLSGGNLDEVQMSLRRRTISQTDNVGNSVEVVAPYDTRTFPLDDDTYDKMLKNMPENHQFQTNYRAQDSGDLPVSYFDEMKADSPGTESTESAIGDEDPNDPEWVDMERAERARDRYKR